MPDRRWIVEVKKQSVIGVLWRNSVADNPLWLRASAVVFRNQVSRCATCVGHVKDGPEAYRKISARREIEDVIVWDRHNGCGSIVGVRTICNTSAVFGKNCTGRHAVMPVSGNVKCMPIESVMR